MTGPSGPVAWREPGFRPSAVKRPAVHLQVSLERVGLGSGPFSERDRATLPEQYEAAIEAALNALGILPLDMTLEARRALRTNERPLEGLDLRGPLQRAREVGAEHLLLLAVRLSRQDLVHCRDSRRPLTAPTTYWEAGLEVLRVSDAAPLLVEPAATEQRVVDVDVDCERGRVAKRRSMDEMIEDSAARALAPLARP